MPDFLLGMNAALYYGTADAVLAALTELTNVKDVTLNLNAGEADVTDRSNSGWRATAASLRECTVDFEMVWKPADAGFAFLRDAYLGNSVVELAVLDQDRSESGAQGPKGNFMVTAFTRSEALEDAIMASVTVKLTKFDEWVTV